MISPALGARQQGVALMAALFLIVVLAGLGTFAMRIGASQEQAVNLTLLGSRAIAAANAGIEFGANRALTAGACNNLALPLTQAALNGFVVQVTCSASTHVVSGVPRQTFLLTAFAQRGAYGRPDYVSRRATRTVTNIP